MVTKPNNDKCCSKCGIIKPIEKMVKGRNVCSDCSNINRRARYSENEELRKKAIKQSTEFKKAKKAIRDEAKKKELDELEKEIGKDNTICKYCKEIKPKTRFRHNRRKCKDCERDDPHEKFKRNVRNRIYIALKGDKTKHTCEYLDCTPKDYIKWITYNTEEYTLENHGTVWHIDHVIPLSKFNLKNDKESW